MKYWLFVKIVITLAVALILTACGTQYGSDSFVDDQETDYTYEYIPYVVIDEFIEQEYICSTFVEDLFIYWDDGITQFGSRIENNATVLYAIENHDSYIIELAVFPSLNVEWGHAETEWCRPQSIFQLDVIDDWVILTAGQIQGSMRNFFGDLHRVRRDGSEREAFGLGSGSSNFIIIDGWIYYNIFNPKEAYGWIRIRPDGTGREFMGDFIHTIILFGDDGYIYGTNAVSGDGNLARWRPESYDSITLFSKVDAPTFDEFYNIVLYQDIIVVDGYVYFTVLVIGTWDYIPFLGWHTPWAALYTANFRVDKDGSNLTLLYERYHMTR